MLNKTQAQELNEGIDELIEHVYVGELSAKEVVANAIEWIEEARLGKGKILENAALRQSQTQLQEIGVSDLAATVLIARLILLKAAAKLPESLLCCFEDLRRHIDALDLSKRERLISELTAEYAISGLPFTEAAIALLRKEIQQHYPALSPMVLESLVVLIRVTIFKLEGQEQEAVAQASFVQLLENIKETIEIMQGVRQLPITHSSNPSGSETPPF